MEFNQAPFKSFAELVDYHIRLHEGFTLRDLYKLVHQSVFGPEHLGPAASERAILEEMETAETRLEEPLIEPISIDAKACRINLRAAGRRGIAPSLIAEALSRSAGKFSRSRGEFSRLWERAPGCIGRFPGKFTIEEYGELTRTAREKGFPPLHHSHSYRKCNRPAYRVLLAQEWERLMPP